MRRYERGDVSIPTAKQHCSASVIGLGQAEAAIFLRHLDSECTNLRESFEIFWRNFTRAIDLIGIDMFAEISFKLPQELFASAAILGALRWVRVNSIEVISSDKQVAGKTAAVLQRIPRGFRKLE